MRIAVIGAGIAGLACAFRLDRAGHDVTVYERDAGVGGRMKTVRAGGFSIDVGTNLLLANYERTRALASEVGLADSWFAFHAEGSGGLLRDEELASFAPRRAFDILRYEGLSWPTRVRLLSFLWKARRFVDGLDFFDLSEGDDALESVDADTFMRSEYGDELVDWLVDPFVRTFHFHGAKRISMKYFDALASLFVDRGGFSTHGFRGYMGSLPDALAARLNVVRACSLVSVVSDGSAVRLEGKGISERFDSVVVATTANTARELLPDATSAQRTLLDAITYSETAMCAYRVPLSVARSFEGIWVPFAESHVVCCCANETRKGARDETDCLFVLGLHDEAARDLASLDDDHLLRLVASEWCRMFPDYAGSMHGLHVERWPQALPVYAPGIIGLVSRFWETGQGVGNVWLCGDYLNHPWVEGSIRCGEKIAGRIDRR